MSNSTKENVSEVFLVLGKRLVDGQLTLEGRSRVVELAEMLAETNVSRLAIVFCGGKQGAMAMSEGDAMRNFFYQHFPELAQKISHERVLVEDQSTTTVENLLNALNKLMDSQFCLAGDYLQLRLVSNDYHIERVVEIEKILPEQGLIGQCLRAGKRAGLALTIPLDINQHLIAPYPYNTEESDAFLLLDQLTSYRVYLEGVVNSAYQRAIFIVREDPEYIANRALRKLGQLTVMSPHDALIMRLAELIELTPSTAEIGVVKRLSKEFGQILVDLKQQLDPESH
nr:YdcF family protein [Vibrio fluminensis]